MEEIKDYVLLDVLITEVDKENDYIKEVVAIKYQDDEIVDIRQFTLGNNNKEELINLFLNFIENNPVVFYHYKLIKRFIPLKISNEIIDIKTLFKEVYPFFQNYSFVNIANYLGYHFSKDCDLNKHALLMNDIFTSLKNELLDRKIKKFICNNIDTVSVASVQRKFLIGYMRAKKLISESVIDSYYQS